MIKSLRIAALIALFVPVVLPFAVAKADEDAHATFHDLIADTVTPVLEDAEAKKAEALALVKDRYIVLLKDGVAADALAKKHGVTADQIYSKALNGYSGVIRPNMLKKVKDDPNVLAVVEDRYVHTMSHNTPASVPTGVNRIDAENLANKGTGIGVAVIDTGIDLDHPDLQANIVANKNCVRPTRNADDDNGHGTHVAGTIAALRNTVGVVGVAPEARLIAVKVLDSRGSGTWSQIICGLDWVTANASKYNIKVINMSLGGGGASDNNCGYSNNDPLHQAVCRARDAGITVVVAAGNSAMNASTAVPASYDDAVITVSALADSNGTAGGGGAQTSAGADDTFASFSNYGSVVDIGAPGVSINSTWKGGAFKVISGTSMATPHVAGAAALYIKSHSGALWTQVRDGLRAAGEPLGSGHTDPAGRFPEPVVKANGL